MEGGRDDEYIMFKWVTNIIKLGSEEIPNSNPWQHNCIYSCSKYNRFEFIPNRFKVEVIWNSHGLSHHCLILHVINVKDYCAVSKNSGTRLINVQIQKSKPLTKYCIYNWSKYMIEKLNSKTEVHRPHYEKTRKKRQRSNLPLSPIKRSFMRWS